MAKDASVREVLVVLALGVAGVLLATLAAFVPWYGVAPLPPVVELGAPSGPLPDAALTVADVG